MLIGIKSDYEKMKSIARAHTTKKTVLLKR